MAERVGNPVPRAIKDQLERGETPLVYELVTPAKDDGSPDDGSSAAELADALRASAQHELLLTKHRIVVVRTDRRSKDKAIVASIPLDEVVAIEAVGSGTERGRLRFGFRDGSSANVVMGLLFPRPGRRLLAAYEAATPGRRR
ncbi:MAG: hypothetical protein OSA99_16770 [Acidimicrobiales bacterium]|nr:hypothetical protein [Acidimicrobiales bacterium]